MSATITDEQIREVSASAGHFTLVILRWTAERQQPGAEAIELEHQRRLVGLRADGVIAMLAPVLSDGLAGVLMMRVSVEEADRIIADDPCVQAGMQTYETYPCLGLFDEPAAG